MVGTLVKEMDRQIYEVVIQAVVDNRVVARETIKAHRKNVLAKCYGGDVTRKKKLLEKPAPKVAVRKEETAVVDWLRRRDLHRSGVGQLKVE